MKHNNKIVVDLKKVQWASHYWKQQDGVTRETLSNPKFCYSVRGEQFYFDEDKAAHYHPDYPFETLYERAKRLDIIDRWTECLYLKLTANESLLYTGEKASQLWAAYRAMVCGSGKKNKVTLKSFSSKQEQEEYSKAFDKYFELQGIKKG